MSQLDIVIVNWNAGEQLRDCLLSIATTAEEGLIGQVVVVDNASKDGSADNLDSIPLPLTVLHNEHNFGFAAACNQGAAVCRSKYLLLLNPDTVLGAGSLNIPHRFMEHEPNANVAVCGIQLVDENGAVSKTCSRAPSPTILSWSALGLSKVAPRWFYGMPMVEWEHDRTRAVDQVMGAFFFVRRTWYTRLNGLDERFFVYFEEVDFCKRIADHRQQIVFLADVQAFHRGGGTSEQVKAHRLFYSRRSRIQYCFKHFSRWPAIAVTAVTLCCEPLLLIARGLFHRSLNEISETMHGYGMLWADLPKFLRSNNGKPAFHVEDHPSSDLAKAA